MLQFSFFYNIIPDRYRLEQIIHCHHWTWNIAITHAGWRALFTTIRCVDPCCFLHHSVKFYDAAGNSGPDPTSSEWSVCFAVFLLLLLLLLLRLDAWWLLVASALDCFQLQVRFAHLGL